MTPACEMHRDLWNVLIGRKRNKSQQPIKEGMLCGPGVKTIFTRSLVFTYNLCVILLFIFLYITVTPLLLQLAVDFEYLLYTYIVHYSHFRPSWRETGKVIISAAKISAANALKFLSGQNIWGG